MEHVGVDSGQKLGGSTGAMSRGLSWPTSWRQLLTKVLSEHSTICTISTRPLPDFSRVWIQYFGVSGHFFLGPWVTLAAGVGGTCIQPLLPPQKHQGKWKAVSLPQAFQLAGSVLTRVSAVW